MKLLSLRSCFFNSSILMLLLVVGCQSNQTPLATQSEQKTPPAVAATPSVQPDIAPNIPPAARVVVRIKAGSSAPFTDSQGNVWLADQGFNGGDTV
jgi:hypothetical protein